MSSTKKSQLSGKDKIIDPETGAVYKNVFVFSNNPNNVLIIPFEKLENFEILMNLDLNYFHQKSREVLKLIYNNAFKNDKCYSELKNYLMKDEL